MHRSNSLEDDLLLDLARRRVQARPWFMLFVLGYVVAAPVIVIVCIGAVAGGYPPLSLAIWALAIVLLVLPWWGYARLTRKEHRRLMAMREGGLCEACGYDLRGVIGATCPECGAVSEGRRLYFARGSVLLSHGIDIVEVSRIAGMLDRHGDRFLERVFTPAEQAYAQANPRRRAEHLAARFAAKEAVLKALGTGLRQGIRWTDIEVTRDAEGRPGLALHGPAARRAESLGIRGWLLSLSHTGGLAMASAIALGEDAFTHGR